MHTLRRMFLMYISFFLFVLLLMVPLMTLVIDQIEQHTLRINQEVLASGLQRLEEELRLITVAADTLYHSAWMRTMRFYEMPLSLPATYHVMQARKFFTDVTGTLNCVSDMGIIYKNGGILASGLYHQTSEKFYGVHFRAKGAETFDQWYDMISRKDASYSITPMTIETKATRDVLVFALSLPLNSYNWKHAAFYAVLNQSDIIDMLLLPTCGKTCHCACWTETVICLYNIRQGILPNTPPSGEPAQCIICK